MSNTNKPVHWAVVGLGWVATDFVAPGIVKSPGSELVACLGSTPDKSRAFAEKFKVARTHPDLESLARDPDVDAVYIALPNAMHHAAVLTLARAGKDILCEKPFAMKIEHAREMVQACRDAGVVLRIAHQIRLDAAVVRAREIVHSGRLGRLAEISLERASGLGSRVSWRNDFEQSGVMYDVGVHLLDLIQYVSGQRFVEVSAFTHPDRRDKKPDDTMTVLGRLEGDCHALAKATREVVGAENNLLIEGTEFQQQVWTTLAKIPYGRTWSYGELAKRIGRPKAVRAVGLANGANPLPIVLPCHRVIGADGSLTGYGGGMPAKRLLLELEGALPVQSI